ncbi:DUF6678 family protein [uncultured Bacteroides sp.]|uniref:DUF6678 family protein n=1 Tax=uncultured Bacteroides sp. TaxID=162156 RepID=UPI00280B1330|nr:DUF6678 family protein [uncultured Bacteroides sp.]
MANTIVEQRHLSPVMNDTKWLKLQTAISSTPDFEPAYEVQLLTDDIVRSPIFEKVPTYLGAWELIYENYEFSFHRFLTLSGLLFIPDLHDTEES